MVDEVYKDWYVWGNLRPATQESIGSATIPECGCTAMTSRARAEQWWLCDFHRNMEDELRASGDEHYIGAE